MSDKTFALEVKGLVSYLLKHVLVLPFSEINYKASKDWIVFSLVFYTKTKFWKNRRCSFLAGLFVMCCDSNFRRETRSSLHNLADGGCFEHSYEALVAPIPSMFESFHEKQCKSCLHTLKAIKKLKVNTKSLSFYR